MYSHVDSQVRVGGETLVADGARQQFISMSAHVQFQGAAAGVAPPAVATDVGQHGVQFRVFGSATIVVVVHSVHVRCHVRDRRELSPAVGTHGRHPRHVRPQVTLQAVPRPNRLPALVAAEGFRRTPAAMHTQVFPQMSGESKRLIADGAGVGAFPGVQKHVGGITLLRV